jgi:hypothetical protein
MRPISLRKSRMSRRTRIGRDGQAKAVLVILLTVRQNSGQQFYLFAVREKRLRDFLGGL